LLIFILNKFKKKSVLFSRKNEKKLRKVAVIDVGTNSVLAVAIDENKKIIYNDFQISQLGRGLISNEFTLHDAGIRTAFSIISNFVEKFRQMGISEIEIVGTSASREATNITTLQMMVLNKFNIFYKVLSGTDEAYYTYMGALGLFKNKYKEFLMMDIGGGSTEIIFGNGKNIKYQKSFPIGALKLFDLFNSKVQLSKQDIKKIFKMFESIFSSVQNFSKSSHFIGIGGVFTTATTIKYKMEEYNSDFVNNSSLELSELVEIMSYVNSKNELERNKIKGLEIKRSPFIVYGMLIYIFFMKKYNIQKVRTTDFGLGHGLAYKLLEKN
jgi:exopolyphosphatase/guanosine-5'-triphosphate,3'-diphosphate pyrophosphatase